MRRRDFLKCASASVLGVEALGRWSAGQATSNALDRYGGWKGKEFRATGFFRLEKENRWWLVTPEGNAFLSFGVNHLHMGWWAQPYNREVWRERLGVAQARGPDFARAFRTWFMQERHRFGFNTLGVHNSLDVLNAPEPFMPYVKPITFVDIPHWKQDVSDDNFVDVFSNDFAKHCDNMAAEHVTPLEDDPYLLGYAMTDCPLLTEEDCRQRTDVIGGGRRAARIGWPRRLRNLSINSAGKRAYVDCVRQLYRNEIRDFNATYGTTFNSFGEIETARDWRLETDLSNGNEMRDNVEFLELVIAKYYQTALNAISMIDAPNLIPSKTGRQHGGLLQIDGTPYQPVRKVLRASADKMYQIATSRL